MTKKVLVTGVAGFIGSNLLDLLIYETDWEIVGIDNLSTGNKLNIEHHLANSRFRFIESQCTDIKTLKDFQCVFHLAALPRIQPSFEYIIEHINANLIQSVHFIELMLKEQYFPKFIYSGSSAIYGNPTKFPTSETERIECLSPYAFQKYEVERYLDLIAQRYPLNYIILRYFNPYGPIFYNPLNKFNAYSSVVGIFMNQYKNGQVLTVTGDGSQKRDFIHVKDVARANLAAARGEDLINDTFNVGSGYVTSILDVAKMISSNIQFIEKRQNEAEITWANIEKISHVLNWSPTEVLEDFLHENL